MVAMALQLRSKCFSIRNPNIIVHRFSSSSSSASNGEEENKESQSPPSPPSFSSYFGDVKASLNRPPSSPPRRLPQSPTKEPLPSFSPTPSKVASLEEIRKNLSEFRRRTAPQVPETRPSTPPVSFQDLYKRNVLNKGEEPNNNTAGINNKGGKLSFDSIRESLRQLRDQTPQTQRGTTTDRVNSKVLDPYSLKSFKDSLKLKPDSPGGSETVLRPSFLKESETKSDADTQDMKTDFVKIYSHEELGEILRKLRPHQAKGGFSLGELNDRLKKLREIEEKEMNSSIGGVSFKDLRESLVKLRISTDDKTRKSPLQRMNILTHIDGTPSFMLSSPKEHLVEKYFHPDNLSSEEKLKLELNKVRDEFKLSESDCGSSRVQVAQLTTKIKHLSSVLHKKDKHSRKGLMAMVQRRKKLLKYMRRTDWDSYCMVISKLGLRDNPDYKH